MFYPIRGASEELCGRLAGLEVDDQLILGRQQDRSDFEHPFVELDRCSGRVIFD